jgi:hypothetical protein
MPQRPIYGTCNDPVGQVARWVILRVTCHQKCNHQHPRGAKRDHDFGVCAGRRAEAEGFEPPVPLGTLAFKVVDRQLEANHLRRFSRSIAPAGPR